MAPPFKNKRKFRHTRPNKIGKTNDFNKYLSLCQEESSHLNKIKHTVHVCLLPEYFDKKKEAVDILLTEELGPYSTELHGFPVAYDPSSVKFHQNMGKVIGIQPVVHFDVSAEFIVFQPIVDGVFEGVINKKTEYMCGCLIHGRFYAAIHDAVDDSMEGWIETVEYGDKISLKLKQIEENQSGYVSIIGSLIKKLESANVSKHSENFGEGDSGVGLEDESPRVNKKTVFEDSDDEKNKIEKPNKKNKKKKAKKKFETSEPEQSIEIKQEIEESEEPTNKKHKKKPKKRKIEENVTESNIPCKVIKQEIIDDTEPQIFQAPEQMTEEIIKSPKKHKKSKKKKVKIKDEPIESEQVFKDHAETEIKIPIASDNEETIIKHKKKKKNKKHKIKQEVE